MKSKTIRRDKLKRDIEKGLYLVKLSYSYSDDYRYDNSGENEVWKEACVGSAKAQTAHDPNKRYLPEHYFEAGCSAREYENGEISFSIHSNLCFELKRK